MLNDINIERHKIGMHSFLNAKCKEYLYIYIDI